MKNLKFAMGLLMGLGAGYAFAQLPSLALARPGLPSDESAAPHPRRSEVRQAVELQAQGRDPGAVGERRLSPEARAELRQQLRQQNQARRDAEDKR